jgi:hypothetical protein
MNLPPIWPHPRGLPLSGMKTVANSCNLRCNVMWFGNTLHGVNLGRQPSSERGGNLRFHILQMIEQVQLNLLKIKLSSKFFTSL